MRFSRNSASTQINAITKMGEERDATRRAEKERIALLEDTTPPTKETLSIIGEEDARRAGAAVIKKDGQRLTLAAETTQKEATRDLIQNLKNNNYEIEVFITTKTKLNEFWQRYKEREAAEEARVTLDKVELEEETINEVEKKIQNKKEAIEFFASLDEDTTTSAVLGYILGAALALRASDVHIEHKTKTSAALKFRIDGDLTDVATLSDNRSKFVVNRIKLLAGLKLNIRDSAQDGRFTVARKNGELEIRASIVPAEFGESVVMRVLDPSAISLGLEGLGLRKEDVTVAETELARPNGMILVTGPTGSGKTTTLYAFLKKLYSPKIKVITIEDPIEYHIQGVEQTQTNADANYTFANGLRSILRQDPDVILVGEIRDEETAAVAVDAALTGHLVLSTLHTNNAAGAIPRLTDLGVKISAIGPAVRLVVAQRLVKKLCDVCKKKTEIDEDLANKISKFIESLPKTIGRDSIGKDIYEAVGCDECDGGYIGRIAIAEMLMVGEEIDSLIREGAGEKDIEKAAIEKQGMVLMQQDGIIKALDGVTTLEEVEKATGPIGW